MEPKTKEEIKKEQDAIRNGTDNSKLREISKIINSTFFRDTCHGRGVKISEEALKEFANMNYRILLQAIADTKEIGGKVILRRYVERLVVG